MTAFDSGCDCEYRGGLSNHLPMALAALARLGASEARRAAFADRYATRLEPAPATVAWTGGDWTRRLGERDAWPAYRSHFTQRLRSDGRDATLRQVLPALLPGCGAAAFHGLIRTAYAVQGGDDAELADALAYWACRHLRLDGTPPATDHGLIFERMQLAAADPGFEREVAAVAIDAGTLERLARAGAVLYAASGDFTVLHMLTGAHALRVLLPFVGDEHAAVADYARAWTAARLASGARAGAATAALRPWPELVAAALASDDEHVIKLVDSCREEQGAHGGDDWQRAASRAVA